MTTSEREELAKSKGQFAYIRGFTDHQKRDMVIHYSFVRGLIPMKKL